MTLIPCPNCGSTAHWRVVEMQQWATPIDLVRTETGFEVEMDASIENVRDMASAVTTGYYCDAPDCGYACAPDELAGELKEASSVQDDRPVQQPGESWDDFSNRKGRYDAAQLEARKQAEHESMPKESPITKMSRVFGGDDS